MVTALVTVRVTIQVTTSGIIHACMLDILDLLYSTFQPPPGEQGDAKLKVTFGAHHGRQRADGRLR